MSAPALPTPTAEELSELLLCARYGDASDPEEMKAFVATYGATWLVEARDDRGNTCLHMAGGNGHAGECGLWLWAGREAAERDFFAARWSCVGRGDGRARRGTKRFQ